MILYNDIWSAEKLVNNSKIKNLRYIVWHKVLRTYTIIAGPKKKFLKKLQRNYKKLMQKSFKRVTIWLQQGQSPKAVCEIFFFLFFGILGADPPPPAVLLHSYDPCAAQAVSRFVCKRARPVFRTSFFAFCKLWFACKSDTSKIKVWPMPKNAWQFVCFSAKDNYKVWRGRGLYSCGLCGKVYTINL